VLAWLAGQGKKVFVDLKFLDVPATVAHAVNGIAQYPVEFCTLHAQHAAMMEAAVAVKGSVKLLGVTVLTSMDAGDLQALGIDREPLAQVRDRARAAKAAGLDGVVASGREAAAIRVDAGADFCIVCPGIRPDGPSGDDQKRTVGVAEAFANGASHIVVGRPLRQAADPQAAARAMQAQIAAAVMARAHS
jgi:orotidine-5'-phosphate decarboxylase